MSQIQLSNPLTASHLRTELFHLPHSEDMRRQVCYRTVYNVMVEWSTLLLRIREVPGSNLGPDIGYTHGISWFTSVPSWDSTLN
jgi:hypothetical protein